jgi:hypothetical protein
MVLALEVTMHVLTALWTMAVMVGFMWCAAFVSFRVNLFLLLTLCISLILPWLAVPVAIGGIFWLRRGDEIRYRYYSRHKSGRVKAA